MANHEQERRILDEAVSVSNIGSKTWCGQTYKNVFTGGTLVSVLMKDFMKYPNRETAIQYSQGLLESRAIISITKRGAFDDGDRLYYINQDAAKNDKNATKSLGSRIVIKNTTQEVNSTGSPQRSLVLLGKEQHASTSVRPLSDLERLLAKDTSQANVRTTLAARKIMASQKQVVKTGPKNVSMVLKDKQSESNKDEELTEMINNGLSRLNSDKVQPCRTTQSSNSTVTTSHGLSITLVEPDVVVKERQASEMGNGSQSCLLERDTTRYTKFRSVTTSSKDKQKLEKTLSPALSALIEKDSRNSQTKIKEKQDIKIKENSDVQKTSSEVNGETDQLLNSWEAFELKLQNKIKNTSPRKSPGEIDPRGQHKEAVAREENDKPKKVLPWKSESAAVSRISSVGSNDRYSKDTTTEQIKLKVDEVLLAPSVAVRKNSFLSSDEHASENEGNAIERVPSLTLSDDSKIIIIDEPKHFGRPGNVVPMSTKNPGVGRERGPSFSLGDTKTVVIEYDVLAKVSRSSSLLSTGDEKSRSRKSSFTSKNESNLTVPTLGSIIQSSDESKHSVQRKNSKTAGEFAPVDDNHNSVQDDNVNVDGQLMPKSLADLLARDGSDTEKKNEKDDEENVFQHKLMELKKSSSFSKSSSVNNESHISVEGKRGATGHIGEREDSPGKERHNQIGITKSTTETNPPTLIVFRSSSTAASVQERINGIDTDNIEVAKSKRETNVEDNRIPLANNEKAVDNRENARAASVAISEDHLKTRSPESLSSAHIPRLNLTSSNSARPNTLTLTSPVDSPAQSRNRYEEMQRRYEAKITELQLQVDYLLRQKNGQINDHSNDLESSASTSDLTSLYSSFSTPLVSPDNSNVTSPSITPRGSMTGESLILSPRSPPPPPPAPPSVPPVGTPTGGHVKPTKPVVNPKTEMKPLFWNRIVSSKDSGSVTKSVWKNIKEPVIDANEFERLFSKKPSDRKLKRTKSLRDDVHFTRINGKKAAKLLDANRSRAIGIKMSSLNCQLEDIRNAVYNMDTSVVDMESLQFIYDIFPKENEIQLIEEHVEKLPSVPLDKPEEFMYQLTKMKHFKERLECWLFEEKFTEVIVGIDRSLTCVTESCSTLTSNAEITIVLSLVLAYGNYMNGNTMRGQADGFHLEVLVKLRDVKTKDSNMSLLQYIVKQYLKQSDKDKGNESRLPSSVSFGNASQVSFDTLTKELLKVSSLLKETEQQTKKIVDECPPDQRNPFEEKMRKFQANAKNKIAETNHKMEKAKKQFNETAEYFQWEPEGRKKSPQEFFSLWAKFMEEIKSCVKAEKQQQQLVKKNFIKVDHLNQIREAATKFRKRRQSVDVV